MACMRPFGRTDSDIWCNERPAEVIVDMRSITGESQSLKENGPAGLPKRHQISSAVVPTKDLVYDLTGTGI